MKSKFILKLEKIVKKSIRYIPNRGYFAGGVLLGCNKVDALRRARGEKV